MRFKSSLLGIADVIGKLWALPYTCLGLAYGLVALGVSRARGHNSYLCFGNNAIQFINSRGILSGRALTLGNVILYGVGASPNAKGVYADASVNLGLHEQAHTYQYQVLGLLFMAVYFCCGGLGGPSKNPLERAAQDYGAGRGSWW